MGAVCDLPDIELKSLFLLRMGAVCDLPEFEVSTSDCWHDDVL